MNIKTLFSGGLIILGVGLIIFAGVLWVKRAKFMADAIEAKGKIVGYTRSVVHDPDNLQSDTVPGVGSSSPIIEFTNVHFFVGDLEILKRFLAMGFTVSFTGVITFARDYDEIVRFAPLDMIMSETDSPFVAPIPHRGQRNSPLYVPEVVRKIAEIRGEDFETVKVALYTNAARHFDIH
jgi:Tat protein secretion system quality control protein TatD with DNase activity